MKSLCVGRIRLFEIAGPSEGRGMTFCRIRLSRRGTVVLSASCKVIINRSRRMVPPRLPA